MIDTIVMVVVIGAMGAALYFALLAVVALIVTVMWPDF
jgi:hypothetical protein